MMSETTIVGEWTGDDIVSQLRSEGIDVHWGGRDGLFHRAADEIERLRARLRKIEEAAWVQYEAHGAWSGLRDCLKEYK